MLKKLHPKPDQKCSGFFYALKISFEMTEIKHVNINELVPYAKNARTHSEHQINQIANSINEFGFNNPILTDGKNGVIAGHGRLSFLNS